MATNAKRESPEDAETSALEVMRAKIRKLEAIVKAKRDELLMKDEELLAKDKELMSKDVELQTFKKDQVDNNEAQENVVVNILMFMNNTGFKGIADKIMSFLDSKSFVQCRLVCRSWKNFIDNEWSMLQRQIFHLKKHPNKIDYIDDTPYPIQFILNEHHLNFGPLIKIMEKSKDKSKLRVFINLCRELASDRYHLLNEDLLKCMIDQHRHQELEMLLDYPVQRDQNGSYYGCHRSFTPTFKYACQYGCGICVRLLLDRSEGKEIDLNVREEWDPGYDETHEYEHCFFAALENTEGFRKEVVDLLLRSSEEKGIDINARSSNYGCTLRTKIIGDLQSRESEIEDYTEATLKILNIDPLRIQDLLSFLRSRRQ